MVCKYICKVKMEERTKLGPHVVLKYSLFFQTHYGCFYERNWRWRDDTPTEWRRDQPYCRQWILQNLNIADDWILDKTASYLLPSQIPPNYIFDSMCTSVGYKTREILSSFPQGFTQLVSDQMPSMIFVLYWKDRRPDVCILITSVLPRNLVLATIRCAIHFK